MIWLAKGLKHSFFLQDDIEDTPNLDFLDIEIENEAKDKV